MKVCFVTTNFPRYLGDSEGTFIWEAARAVKNAGHQVRVIAQHWPNYPSYEWMEEIEVIRPRYWWPETKALLRQEGGGLPMVWKKSWLARWQMIPFLIVHTLAVARYARDCDVIHAQWTLSAGAAHLSRIIHRRPIVGTLQGSDLFQVPRHPIGAWITKLVLQGCDRILVLSRALAKATDALGLPASAVTIIPNGVDLASFTPPKGNRELILLYVGSLIERKGIRYLLEALTLLRSSFPSLRLIVVGDGPERVFLAKKVADLGIAKQVTFIGTQAPYLVKQWMRKAKIFVLPSIEEGLGVVLLEALASGTPVVASNVGGIPDVITPDVGLLVPPAQTSALAEAICQILQDDNYWISLSQNARKRAESHYDWRQIAAQFVEIYRELVD